MGVEINAKGICRIDALAYPAIGFGTYPLRGHECQEAVSQAYALGYRIVDTATRYQNFTSIAKALQTSEIKRKEIYIISKVWPDAQTPEKLKEDLKKTLKELQLTYLDAYLLHWPNSQLPIEAILETMNAFKEAGLIRHIGLSNVTVNHLKRVLEIKMMPTWIQVEMHPFFYDPKLLGFCKENAIAVQAWAPLSRGNLTDDPLLVKVGKKYHKTAAQVALRWIVQHQCLPLPRSQNPEHMKQNLSIADFNLSLEEMEEINSRAARGERKRITKGDGLGFTDEFDFSYEQCWPKGGI